MLVFVRLHSCLSSLQLENFTPLEPLEDEDDARDEAPVETAQPTANLQTVELSGASDLTLQGSNSDNGVEAALATLAMEEEDNEE